MSDIVKRLRRATTATGMYGACNEAADEIERLRGRLAEAERERDEWKAAALMAGEYCGETIGPTGYYGFSVAEFKQWFSTTVAYKQPADSADSLRPRPDPVNDRIREVNAATADVVTVRTGWKEQEVARMVRDHQKIIDNKKKPCPRCFGKSPLCQRCQGTGMVDAPTSADDPSCPDCDGEGTWAK